MKFDWIRNLALAAMFFGGFLGAQSITWGWLTAILGLVLMVLTQWAQRKKDQKSGESE